MQTATRRNGEARFVYEMSPEESVSEAVITAISTVSDTEPVPDCSSESGAGLDPLYTVVDPDALDAIFHPAAGSNRPTGRVIFRYHGYEVSVHSDGHIFLEQIDSQR